MNKTKRTLIFSSCIMAMALVVVIVSVTAAWFGDMKSTSQSGFTIQSDTLQDVASIDINSSKGMTGERIYPAVAQLGYLAKGGTIVTGAPLKETPLPAGVAKAAEVATVYFPIQFIGTSDKDFEAENRKSLRLLMSSANIGKMIVTAGGNTLQYDRTATANEGENKLDAFAGTWSSTGNPSIELSGLGVGSVGGVSFTYTVDKENETASFSAGGVDYTVKLVDFKDEFNVEICLVEGNLDANGVFQSEKSVIPTTDNYAPLTGASVFYDSVGYDTYMLVQPGLTYFVKAQIYFNHVDEECNLDLLNTVVRFNFKLSILNDGTVIRNHTYRTAGA